MHVCYEQPENQNPKHPTSQIYKPQQTIKFIRNSSQILNGSESSSSIVHIAQHHKDKVVKEFNQPSYIKLRGKETENTYMMRDGEEQAKRKALKEDNRNRNNLNTNNNINNINKQQRYSRLKRNKNNKVLHKTAKSLLQDTQVQAQYLRKAQNRQLIKQNQELKRQLKAKHKENSLLYGKLRMMQSSNSSMNMVNGKIQKQLHMKNMQIQQLQYILQQHKNKNEELNRQIQQLVCDSKLMMTCRFSNLQEQSTLNVSSALQETDNTYMQMLLEQKNAYIYSLQKELSRMETMVVIKQRECLKQIQKVEKTNKRKYAILLNNYKRMQHKMEDRDNAQVYLCLSP